MTISIISDIVLNDIMQEITPELPMLTSIQMMPELGMEGNITNIINLSDDDFMENLLPSLQVALEGSGELKQRLRRSLNGRRN